MKKYNFLMTTACFGMLFLSCVKTADDKNTNPFIDKSENQKKAVKTLVADLPSLIENTDFIVFSVRDNVVREQKRSSYDSDNWYNNYIDNLIFQHIKTQETHVLTKKKIKIISFERFIDSLNPTLNTTIYQVIDSFPNNEKQETFTALYLSTNEGKNFTKITKSNEHLTRWKFIPETKNIYFTTANDTNSNRKLDEQDGQSIHSVSINDFIRKDLLVEELQRLN
ncbi:hypothetical protein JBL43_17680 [Aureibaculum sp. A20]|uniref:Lipoprotein n=1 Tax=Aureibaculum flavum TaxID=2795986 RepID=A0ABS0WVQ7_9FLAO|nr:hypothetical protein [Aureibaculum flavum]MBJ2176087.1 hypothetical protein [Aureibaculum flavum]